MKNQIQTSSLQGLLELIKLVEVRLQGFLEGPEDPPNHWEILEEEASPPTLH